MKTYDITESQVRADIKRAFDKLGVKVWATSDRRKAHGTRGLPDFLVSLGAYGLMLGLEVKRPKGGKLSEEQKDQESSGMVVTVKSDAEAIDAWWFAKRIIGKKG